MEGTVLAAIVAQPVHLDTTVRIDIIQTLHIAKQAGTALVECRILTNVGAARILVVELPHVLLVVVAPILVVELPHVLLVVVARILVVELPRVLIVVQGHTQVADFRHV